MIALDLTKEFSGLDFGNKKRNKSIECFVSQMQSNFCTNFSGYCAASGSVHLRKTVSHIMSIKKYDSNYFLSQHFVETGKRCALDAGPILIAQDTVFLKYTNHSAKDFLGNIGKRGNGLCQHNAIVMNTYGVPQGLLLQHTWARGKDDSLKPESNKWFLVFDQIKEHLPADKEKIIISDSESDIGRYIREVLKQKCGFVVRIYQDRIYELENESELIKGKLSLILPNLEVVGKREINIIRNKKPVTVLLEVSYGKVAMHSTKKEGKKEKEGDIYIVQAREIRVWESGKPSEELKDSGDLAHWVLLTSCPVKSFEDASLILHYYSLRWQVERLHLIMKSAGSEVEKSQLENRSALLKYIAISSVKGISVMRCKEAKRLEDAGISNVNYILTPEEKVVLEKVTKRSINSVSEAILSIGIIAGFVPSKRTPLPGIKSLWKGLEKLSYYIEAYHLMNDITNADNSIHYSLIDE